MSAAPDVASGQLGLVQGWPDAPRAPRRWQAEALEAVLHELGDGRRTIVSAVMGAGKSVLIAELAARRLAAGEKTVLVTTPTMALVDQLADTLRERLGAGVVGRYFTHAKDADRPVIVACNASATTVGEAVAGIERRVDTWIADEVHKTETGQIREAHLAIKPVSAVGFTATPFRSDKEERLALWESVAYRYSLGDALRDGVLVPWRVVHWGGQGESSDIDRVCWGMIKGAEGPGMINASSIEDAEKLKIALDAAGMTAGVVHSKRSQTENQSALEQLRAGGLRVVVHVNMLAEGVDMPWLRWLCLRRPVGARVRFVQEVGRVLRCAPGKTEAVIYDPHDLFGSFGWHYEEALGEWEAEQAAEQEEREEEQEREEQERKRRDARVTDPITAWCRRLLLPLQAAGMADADRVLAHAWRLAQPSGQQLSYLRWLADRGAWGRLPEPHRGLVARVVGDPRLITRGGASDLISIAVALRKARREYPTDVDIAPPPDGAFDGGGGNGDAAWYAAAAYRKTSPEVAFVVVHGGRVAYQSVRPRAEGETWVYAQRAAATAARRVAASAGEESPDVVLDCAPAAAAKGCRCVKDEDNPARAQAWRVLSLALKGRR